MHFVDYLIIIIYLLLILAFGFYRQIKKNSSASELILGGRVLTLPAFVASLVSTWYGGILGVGEFTYNYGISNWLVFGLPYYLAAFIFALFLAKKARESEILTLPDRLAAAYDKKTALTGSVIIYLMTVPAAYVLMIGTLVEILFGWDLWVGIICGTLFSIVYIFTGGFRSVVRTDLFQFVLMFLGFIVLLVVCIYKFGGVDYLIANTPQDHFSWHGGNSGFYIISWYIIALAALVEPTFYQRCYAAKTPKVARKGILISILCWAFFDFLTTSCGLYARAIVPNLENPIGAFPALALEVLPTGLMGLFALSMMATIMSTIDSYAFVSATTFSRDIIMKIYDIPEKLTVYYTRLGLALTFVLAILPLLILKSVVDIWYLFGTVGTPALMIPVFTSFVGKRRMSPMWVMIAMISSGLLSLGWYFGYLFLNIEKGNYILGLEPIIPGMVLSLLIYLFTSKKVNI